MKKFIIFICTFVTILFIGNIAYYRFGYYIDLNPNKKVEHSVEVRNKDIFLNDSNQFKKFEIRGMDIGVGLPGKWATDYAINKETYLRWFKQIQEMGINTIRVYTILNADFYDAFYEYNINNKKPLYLLHGIWINDYIFNSHADAYDKDLYDILINDCKTLVDIIHGKKTIALGYEGVASGIYRNDISKWVIGYILGVEWETSLVTYTNLNKENADNYKGKYLYTKENARPFESFLADVGDKVIDYETSKYKSQRMLAFANWPNTDPFVYPVLVSEFRNKYSCVDVENIMHTDLFKPGMFASYHVYPYFPDYLESIRATSNVPLQQQYDSVGGYTHYKTSEYRLSLLNAPKIEDYVDFDNMYDKKGRLNTYYAYLKALNSYHTIPVIISEYGVTSGRGMASLDINTNRNQGFMNEQEQGKALVECYEDIINSGCAGSCLFSWQDEWFKRTWNTLHYVKMDKRPYWSDYQTNEQFFGVLTFDPGKDKCVSYVDGDISEWKDEDIVVKTDDLELSMKYDEKFLYFMIYKEDLNIDEDNLYIPLDITHKSGTKYCKNLDLSFNADVDFVININKKDNSRILVQKYYDPLLCLYSERLFGYNVYYDDKKPKKDTSDFHNINLALNLSQIGKGFDELGSKYETGKLRYGNANPDNINYDSLADFISNGDYIEMRIPWGLLNFSNPSNMEIHDDFYECYGFEDMPIDKISVGIDYKKEEQNTIPLFDFKLKPWNKKVTYHERLKESYYILKDYWNSLDN